MNEDWDTGPAYACPRCGTTRADWQGMRQHLRQSARCRTVFEDFNRQKVVQRQCRSAAARRAPPPAGGAGTLLPEPSGRSAPTSKLLPRWRTQTDDVDSTTCSGLESSGPESSVLLPPRRSTQPDATRTPAADALASSSSGEDDEDDDEGPRRRQEAGASRDGAAPRLHGVGAEVAAMSGRIIGRVVSDERRSWRLDDGRAIRKTAEGKRWRWASGVASPSQPPSQSPDALFPRALTSDSDVVTDREFRASPMASHCRSPDLGTLSESAVPEVDLVLPEPALPVPQLAPRGNRSRCQSGNSSSGGGVGHAIVGADAKPWGRVIAEEPSCWRLADGRCAKKSNEGRKWRWCQRGGAGGPPSPGVAPARGADDVSTSADVGNVTFPELALRAVCDWLVLGDALPLLAVCREWASLLVGRLPLLLPPPQLDAFLQFCLLEVLMDFDDDRLPLPMSAVYGEMRTVARRAIANPVARGHLEISILRPLGQKCSSQQRELLMEGRPQHVHWEAELKNSGFKTLERLSKHFHAARLIETFHQRWRKRVHHSHNSRSCAEWLLTKVNRGHPLFVEHARWQQELAEGHQLATLIQR